MREYLKLKTYDAIKAFWDHDKVKELEGCLNISKVPQPFLLTTDSCEFDHVERFLWREDRSVVYILMSRVPEDSSQFREFPKLEWQVPVLMYDRHRMNQLYLQVLGYIFDLL